MKLVKSKDKSFNEAIELYLKMKYRINNNNPDYLYNFNKEVKNLELIKQYYLKKYKIPNGYIIILNILFPFEISERIIKYTLLIEYFNK